MKATYLASIAAALAVLCAGAGAGLAQHAVDAGDLGLPAALQDPSTVAASGLLAGSAWLAVPDASGSLGPALRLAEWRFDDRGNIL
ncbi:MAG: hypothetical protein C4574_03460, partial [Candidatus Latescibacterota bacterium]